MESELPHTPPWLCIVLDIDGTLIDEDTMEARPYLREFLHTCFCVCARVAIWTAAGSKWLETVHRLVLQPCLQENQKFAFMWHGDRCSMVTNKQALWAGDMYAQRISRKRLKKVWRSNDRKNEGFGKNSTLIVDDTPRTYSDNYGNAIPIPTFTADLHGMNDACLLNLAAWLRHMNNVHKSAESADIRTVHKRQWATSSPPCAS